MQETPSTYIGEGEFYIREASPLFDSPHSGIVDKGVLRCKASPKSEFPLIAFKQSV
jgi:hypothetical protein